MTPPARRSGASRRTDARDASFRRPVPEPSLPPDPPRAGVDDLDDDVRLDEVAIGPGSAAGRAIDGLTLRRSSLTGVRLTGATLQGLELVDVLVEDCELAGVTFTGARFTRVTFRGCRMSGVVANDVTASDMRIIDTKADEIWLRSARLEQDDVVLLGSTFAGARGLGGLRNATIGTGQLVEVGLPILAALGVVVDDAALDPPDDGGPAGHRPT